MRAADFEFGNPCLESGEVVLDETEYDDPGSIVSDPGRGSDQPLCLVTGGCSGIGFAVSLALAGRGYRVVITSRAEDRAQLACRRIRKIVPVAGISGRVLDLASRRSIEQFAASVLADCPSIDVVIHNAGAVYPQRKETPEGFDAQFATAVLGPFLLTELLRGRLAEKRGARVINVVSDLHRGARLDLDELHSRSDYHYLRSYRRAELAKILWSYALARRVRDVGTTVNCVHPGGVRTGLFREFRGVMGMLWWLSGWLKKSPSRGARGIVHLATAPRFATDTGRYFRGARESQSSAISRDERLQEALWDTLSSCWDQGD